MEKKYETFTYSELVAEFKTVTEKTETLKKDLILEMAKRKELEGIERKKIAAVITNDLKELVSSTWIRNTLSGSGQTDTSKTAGKIKKEIEEEQKILVAAGMGTQELEPPTDEPEKQIQPQENEDLHSLITSDNEIIDQRPESEKLEETKSDAEEDVDRIHLIRQLKVENNNLTQQISDLERLRDENNKLRETITELEKENSKLFARNEELEKENNRLKQENRALRNPPAVSQVPSMFSSKKHDEYLQNRNKLTKK